MLRWSTPVRCLLCMDGHDSSVHVLQGKNTPLSDVAKQFFEMREAGFRIHPWP